VSSTEYAGFWIAVFGYALGAAMALAGLVFKKQRLMNVATLTCATGLLGHLIAIGARIAFTGHLPVASRYENVLTGAAVVMIFTLISIVTRWGLQPLLVFVAPFTLLMMGYALLNQPRYTTMSLVLDNLWMFVHILFAWLAYGAYSLAAGLGVMHLMKSSRRVDEVDQNSQPEGIDRLPREGVLDDLIFRFVILGFLGHVVMVASGSIWARDLWGSYWNWDPVETWSLLSALLYGLWIHLRLTLHWRGRRMSWLAVGSLVTVLLAFWGTTILGPTSHSMDDLRLRVPEQTEG
jgi:cytochrome c-type biogenesis protein CcsB